MNREQILAEVRVLDPKDRESLAEEIWLSINHATQDEIGAAWAKDAENRIAGYDHDQIEDAYAPILQVPAGTV